MEYFKRQIESYIKQENEFYPALLLTGPRQVGKSTLLLHLREEDRTYVSLDDPALRNFATYSPELFFERYTPPILIDEIQYAPGLFPYIKVLIDELGRNSLFWLTGSQIFPLMQGVQESLAGRVRSLQLSGFSHKEFIREDHQVFPRSLESLLQEKVEAVDIAETLIKGSMPRVILQDGIDVQGYYQSYVDTYVSRDVREISNVLDTGLFLRFISLLATRTAQELNLASLARELAVDSSTVRRWLDILLTSGLLMELPAYSGNLGKRLIKRPKIYFTDTGLLCYLLGITSLEAFSRSPLKGALFENWVVSEIDKSHIHNGSKARMYYYRDSNQKEIDLIIEDEGLIYPLEIKLSAKPSHAEKSFSVLAKLSEQIPYYGIICPTNSLSPVKEKVWKIPASLI